MLIPIKYHKRNYPDHIKANIDEISGHFDISKISPRRQFCLHTEYSYGKRKLNSKLMMNFPVITVAHKKHVPQLWYNRSWAIEFANFIIELCGQDHRPKIIEIHPPFTDYLPTVDAFLNIYQSFEDLIKEHYRDTEIVIENRSGSIYSGGKFLISSVEDLIILSSEITKKKLQLKIALDIPQLITSYGGPEKLTPLDIDIILNDLNEIKHLIRSIHLWGKRKSATGRTVAHIGDLETYFGDQRKKSVFLEWFSMFVNDGEERYFVPEVNSSDEDLWSIVKDLEDYGVKFG